jgi:arginyl-tRNA synthetase
MGKDDETKRFINKDKIISDEKLVFLKAISNTIRSGMNIVGVSTPEQM